MENTLSEPQIIPIDKEIPIPRINLHKKTVRFPFIKLNVGESFFVANRIIQKKYIRRLTGSYNQSYRNEKKFMTRTVIENNEEDIRVWRIR